MTSRSIRTFAAHRGHTLAEVVVAAACCAAITVALVPMLAAVSGGSGEARSLSNLRFLVGANDNYAATFGQRQFTAMPDDAGLVNGNCSTYVSSIACPPQQILGVSSSGAIWGYFLGGGLCSQYGYPGSCAGWPAYKPIEMTGQSAQSGAFRLPNVAAFNQFVDGRFFSDYWYSPNDRAMWQYSATVRDAGGDYESLSGNIGFSSYCWSPAAMYHPDVFGSAYGGYRNPNSFAEGYISPTVTQCAYPDLKTRMIEHSWNVNAPSFVDNSLGGSYTAFPYNASAAAHGLAMFFDGSVRRLRNVDAIADDASLFEASGARLWSRGTPFGEAGYLASQALDSGPRTSHTTLTIDGILGRDRLSTR